MEDTEQPQYQPHLKDLDRTCKFHEFHMELRDQSRTETVRCHEMTLGDGVVQYKIRLKNGTPFLVGLYPLDRISSIDEYLYDEEDWYFDTEYR